MFHASAMRPKSEHVLGLDKTGAMAGGFRGDPHTYFLLILRPISAGNRTQGLCMLGKHSTTKAHPKPCKPCLGGQGPLKVCVISHASIIILKSEKIAFLTIYKKYTSNIQGLFYWYLVQSGIQLMTTCLQCRHLCH